MKILAGFGLSLFMLYSSSTGVIIEPSRFDSEALNKALEQSEPGDTIQLQEGVYRLNKAISVPSQRKLIGAGQDKTTLVFAGEQAGVFVALNGCEDVELAHLTLDGQDNPLVHQGIGGSNARRLWLHHLTIRNLKAKTWGPHGILFSGKNPTMERGVTDSRISDCLIENVGLDAEYGGGIRLAWGSARNRVEDNVIRNTGRGGIFGDHSAELVILRNSVSGSGGTGLGIEIWGGCPRSLIEDNTVDHWISVDRGDQSAVRRNTVGTDDGTLKGYGIEIIARDMVVTDNVVNRGASIGLSISNCTLGITLRGQSGPGRASTICDGRGC
nr:right-handed parallel beta-helix repeat-containing protein [Planctomycetota bacterium]